jgi:hypothetical protein
VVSCFSLLCVQMSFYFLEDIDGFYLMGNGDQVFYRVESKYLLGPHPKFLLARNGTSPSSPRSFEHGY